MNLMSENPIYFLYRHIRLDNQTPFYIGIGTFVKNGPTLKQKYRRAFSKGKRNKYWINIVNKHGYEVEIMFHTKSIDLIKEKEKEFINLYGRRSSGGILCNLTDGGFGIEGFKHSDESKSKIGVSSRERPRKKGYKLNLTEEGRNNIILAQTGKKVSEETRKKISNHLLGNSRGKGHSVSESHRLKIKETHCINLCQYDLLGNFIQLIQGFSGAKNLGFDSRGIKRNINGQTQSYKGFLWRYGKLE